MTREDLVEVITELRLGTGVTTSIKEAVVEEFMEAIGGITPTEIRPGVRVSRPASTVAVMDPMQAMMMQMMLLMKREEREGRNEINSREGERRKGIRRRKEKKRARGNEINSREGER